MSPTHSHRLFFQFNIFRMRQRQNALHFGEIATMFWHCQQHACKLCYFNELHRNVIRLDYSLWVKHLRQIVINCMFSSQGLKIENFMKMLLRIRKCSVPLSFSIGLKSIKFEFHLFRFSFSVSNREEEIENEKLFH